MKSIVFFITPLILLSGCSSIIPPDVEAQASRLLSVECMNGLRNPSYQKRSRDVLTPNPIFAVSLGKEGGRELIACGMMAANASTNFNLSGAMVQCENSREFTMTQKPRSVMGPCEVYAEGNNIVFRTQRATELLERLKEANRPQ